MSSPPIGQPRLFEPPPAISLTLADRFLVPPFSVLDSRAGYWQARKRDWLRTGLRSEIGRGEDLASLEPSREVASLARDGMLMRDAYAASNVTGAPDLPEWANNGTAQIAPGTSIFDPVLCELMYRWFVPEGGSVLDPFAGGSVRGIIAGIMGRDYTGIDLRAEQVAANEQQRVEFADRLVRQPQWVTGDARDLADHVGGSMYDFVFTCPPYFDLEIYSDDPRDLSAADDYPAFRAAYTEIIADACARLRPNRFAAIVVSEVRSKKDGSYVGLVPDTHRAFEAAGLRLYNEAILLNQVGTLALRVSSSFGAGRKLGRSHQNVLVFVKGDGRAAADACGMVDEVAVEQGGATWRADAGVELRGERTDLAAPDDLL